MSARKQALGLFSGGLDSMLAAALLRDQGILVTAVVFITPFFGPERARESAAHLGIPLMEEDLLEEFYPLLLNPPHGFGSQHNPCIDCHILMLRRAGALMERLGFDFLFTGEVLGQRPMSQNRGMLIHVARHSGYEDLILRPLSAKLLPPTRPELSGWVDREQLLDIHGRGRKRQMELAARLGITSYPSPGGGCLLTDPGYAARLKELLSHDRPPSRRDLELLKWGRHFRLPGGTKAVVGRTRRENEMLARLAAPGDLVLRVQGVPGPLVLVPDGTFPATLEEAAALTASYSDAAPGRKVIVLVRRGGKIISTLSTVADPKERFKPWLV